MRINARRSTFARSGRDHCSKRWGHPVCNPTSWSTSRSTPFTLAQSQKTQQLGIWDLWLWSPCSFLWHLDLCQSFPPCSLIQLGSMEWIWKVSEMAKLNDVLLSKWRNHLDLVKQQVYYEGQENHLGRVNEVAQCRINVVTRCLGTQHEDYGLSVCHL